MEYDGYLLVWNFDNKKHEQFLGEGEELKIGRISYKEQQLGYDHNVKRINFPHEWSNVMHRDQTQVGFDTNTLFIKGLGNHHPTRVYSLNSKTYKRTISLSNGAEHKFDTPNYYALAINDIHIKIFPAMLKSKKFIAGIGMRTVSSDIKPGTNIDSLMGVIDWDEISPTKVYVEPVDVDKLQQK